MDFNNHDLHDFTARIRNYKKQQRISFHKKTALFPKENLEKKIEGFTVKVLNSTPVVEKLVESQSKRFFNETMQRHKRRLINK